jgi:hypothetical protein
MYLAIDCLDFFKNGNFSLYKYKKDCPSNTVKFKIKSPCFIEIKFIYDKFRIIPIFAKQFNNKTFCQKDYCLSSLHKSNPTLSRFEELENGYRYHMKDFSGQDVLCRALTISHSDILIGELQW